MPEDLVTTEADATSKHLPQAARWLNEAWARAMGYSDAQSLAWCIALAGAQSETLILASRGEQLLGTAAVVTCDLPDYTQLTPWLSSLYVTPAARRGGIGRALIAAACRWVQDRGQDAVYLYAREGALLDYYARLGWSPMQGLTLEGESFVLMRKALASPLPVAIET